MLKKIESIAKSFYRLKSARENAEIMEKQRKCLDDQKKQMDELVDLINRKNKSIDDLLAIKKSNEEKISKHEQSEGPDEDILTFNVKKIREESGMVIIQVRRKDETTEIPIKAYIYNQLSGYELEKYITETVSDNLVLRIDEGYWESIEKGSL